jgi:carboxymethylenebutenolidase
MPQAHGKRLTAADFDQELLVLFDAYVHGSLDRRGFLERASKFAVGGVTAAGLLAALSPNFAMGQVIAPDDKRIASRSITIDSPKGYGPIRCLESRPAGATGKLPIVLVVHENRGLNPHIEDVARRLALEGYLAIAPDALSPLGGYPGDEDKARNLFAQLDQAKTREDFLAAAQASLAHPDGNGRLGVIGFCWGGGIAHTLATLLPTLAASVPFYGNHPIAADAARVKAPLLIHYADVDERINAGWPAYETALKAAGVRYVAHRCPGTQHGFHNDTTPRYDAAAAKLAWDRSRDFLAQHLKG